MTVTRDEILPLLNDTASERFWPKVDKGSPDECWEWRAYRDKDGYGWFNGGLIDGRKGEQFGAHRVSYALTYGEIGKLQIDHRCNNPPCVNPAHLHPVTARENTIFCDSKSISAKNFAKTHCDMGHKFTKENTALGRQDDGGPMRTCRMCERDRHRRRRAALPPKVRQAKTHCVHGHEFTELNTYISPRKKAAGGPYRVCVTCRNEWKRRKRRLEKLGGEP